MNEIHGNAISKKQPVFFSPRFKGVQEIMSHCYSKRRMNYNKLQNFKFLQLKEFDKDNHVFFNPNVILKMISKQ